MFRLPHPTGTQLLKGSVHPGRLWVVTGKCSACYDHCGPLGMFSFARQKRTRKAPATFEAREARTRGCSPLVTPKRMSSGKNRAVCPAAQTLFRFFPSSDFECCARFSLAGAESLPVLLLGGSPCWANPLRHGFAVPPPPRGGGFGKGKEFARYRLTGAGRWPVSARLTLFAKGSPFERLPPAGGRCRH